MKKQKVFVLCLILVLLLGSISAFSYSISNRQIYFTRYSIDTEWTKYLNFHGEYSFSLWDQLWNNDNPSFKLQCGNRPNNQYYWGPQGTVRNGSDVPDSHWIDFIEINYGTFDYRTWQYERTWYAKGDSYNLNLTTILTHGHIDNTYSWCRYWSGHDTDDDMENPSNGLVWDGTPVSVQWLPMDC